MKELLRNEINRIIHARLFWVAIVIGCVVTVSQYFMMVVPCVKYLDLYKMQPFGSLCPHTWYEKWIGGELISSQAYIFFLIIPLLAVFPHSVSLAVDRKSGYICHMFLRKGKKEYYYSKFLSTFISGGFVVVVPLLLNIVLSMCTLPSIYPDKSTGTSMIAGNKMWESFYFDHPNIYIIAYLIMIFLFAGTVAVFALTLGTYIYNYYVIFVLPFVMYLFVYALCFSMRHLEYCPFMYLTPSQRVEWISFRIIFTEWLIFFAGTCLLYYRSMKKDESLY